MRRIAAAGGLLAFTLAASLGVGELFVRLLLPAPSHYRVYAAGLDFTFEPRSEIMPGVSGPSRFVTNSQGMRADEPTGDETWRILAVGGSTTQCLYLDQAEAWPQRLQELLREDTGQRVWVGNVGKAGRYSSEHVLQVRHLLEQHEEIDALVLLLGANDAYRRLGAERYRPRDPERPEDRAYLLPRAFEEFPLEFALVPPSRSALYGLLDRTRRQLRSRSNWRNIEDRAGRNYAVWREHRAGAARLRDALPDLGDALEEYVGNLDRMAALAREHAVRVVFLTQPTIYRDDLPERERSLLWMGRVGPLGELGTNDYYSVASLARAFATYNEALLGFCRESGSDCIDLAAALPKDTRSFYDDVHFNEEGAERVARALLGHLRARPPFAD